MHAAVVTITSFSHLLRKRHRLASESNLLPILEAQKIRPNFPKASLRTQLIAAAAPRRRDLIPRASNSAYYFVFVRVNVHATTTRRSLMRWRESAEGGVGEKHGVHCLGDESLKSTS